MHILLLLTSFLTLVLYLHKKKRLQIKENTSSTNITRIVYTLNQSDEFDILWVYNK